MLEVTHRGGVAILRMSHGKANALDTEFCRTLAATIAELRGSAAKAVVLTGQGRIFSAGVDLRRALDAGADYLREFLPALSKLFETAFFFPKPLVAAVNGHAVAGGCVLACAADRRLCADGAGRIGVTELLVGVPFPALALEIMRFVTAPARFPEVVLGGATFAPKDAAALGLVDEVVAAERLTELAVAAAEQLAALRPEAFALTKSHIRQPVRDRFEREGRGIDASVAELWLAPETLTRMRDYVARTFKK
jgi:enoyl-CoA hydratase